MHTNKKHCRNMGERVMTLPRRSLTAALRRYNLSSVMKTWRWVRTMQVDKGEKAEPRRKATC